MHEINRRDFLKKSGLGLAAVATSGLWFDKLFAGTVPSKTNIFTQRFGVSTEDMKKILGIALSKGGDFSELYFEYSTTNAVMMEENIVKRASENISLGVGIRVIKGDQTGYAYTNDLSFEGMKKAALTSAAISSSGKAGQSADLRVKTFDHQVYDMKRPLAKTELGSKLALVRETHDSVKAYDKRVVLARSFLVDQISYITIANSEGLLISDIRPGSRLVSVAVAMSGSKRTSGYHSAGGRVGMNYYQKVKTPKEIGRLGAEEAITLLSAVDAVAGEQPVVLGAGQSGVMIHEAVGHPFEADGIRKKTSIYWDKFGQAVAKPIVNIFEDPTIPHYRGSLNIDDEGMKTRKTMLVEKGKLVGFIQDNLNAKLMGEKPTGNARRDSYQSYPLPRMTNTVLVEGENDPQDIIKTVKKGFYAKSYEGGNVQDSGKFTFSVNLGYLIENGKITKPVRNATLIGTNVQIMNEVSMIGNDMGFFLGTCGKEGQLLPVTAGTPTLKIDKMTVGGR